MSHNTTPFTVLIHEGKSKTSTRLDLVREEPLSIRVQGRPYAVVMRTPGDEPAHVAGFCLAEGIVDSLDDIETIASCEGEATNVVTLTVTPARLTAITDVLERRGFISQTSCGICGKELVEDLSQMVPVLPDGPSVDLTRAYHCLETLKERQTLYRRTRASHAAAIYTSTLDLLSLAEDVGRHNALDKAVGVLFLKRGLSRAGVLILSSRISYEMVQKAARAEIPFIMAASRPTALAVELAESLNMTLASPSKRDSGIQVYTGPRRVASPVA
ncbi:MAG: formate dehydrogenase accessory sulfurtransferase FdhD [Thermodesulfobacteriota bacterium]